MKGKGLQEDFLLHYNLNNKAYDQYNKKISVKNSVFRLQRTILR